MLFGKLSKNLLLIAVLIGAMMVCGCSNTERLECSRNLTVMSYNIHFGVGTDKVLDLERIAEVIKSQNADIVCLNEVDKNFPDGRSDFKYQAKELAKMLDMNYAFEGNIRLPLTNEGVFGNAILSRFPIQSWENHTLYQKEDEEIRGCIEANININGQIYNVFATHFDCHRSHDIRTRQAEDIIEVIRKKGGKNMILTGDFNATVGDAPIETIKKSLYDSFDLANKSKTHGTLRTGKRIDFIFVSGDLKDSVKEYRVIKNEMTKKASDHFPVISRISIK